MPDYEIGYGRPPKETRFKPGQSGNPKGRNKGSKNFNTLLSNNLNAKITIETPTGSKKITKKEAIVTQLINHAITGDTKAIQTLFPFIMQLEADIEHKKQLLENVKEEDEKILKGFINAINNTTTTTSSNTEE